MNDQEQALRDAFLKCGWSAEHPPAVASRTFVTACAPKQAFVYLYPNGVLRGQYESEGRNALATVYCEVGTIEPAAIHERVSRLDAEICSAVDATYARSLWLQGVRPRQLPALIY